MCREEYIRTLLRGYTPVEIAPLGYADLAKELNRIGVNLNQIAAVANSKGFIDKSEYKKQYNKVMEVCSILIHALVPKPIESEESDDGIL